MIPFLPHLFHLAALILFLCLLSQVNNELTQDVFDLYGSSSQVTAQLAQIRKENSVLFTEGSLGGLHREARVIERYGVLFFIRDNS